MGFTLMQMGSVHDRRYQRFLERLRKARLEADFTQEEVAAKLKKPQSFVSKCETGERRVDIIELQLFAKLYRKSLTWFVS